MGDLVYLDPCNKRFVDKYTKLASVPSKQSTKPAKATIYSFVESNHRAVAAYPAGPAVAGPIFHKRK